MNAIILCAGQGKRLLNSYPNTPKCLIPLADKTLLDRHILNLLSLNISHISFVVGYQKNKIIHHFNQSLLPLSPNLQPHFIHNPQFHLGSLYSLALAQKQFLNPTTLIMDADVLYHPDILQKLVLSPSPNALIIDTNSKPNPQNPEEMMVAIQNQKVTSISRSLHSSYSLTGESVGFFKVSYPESSTLTKILQQFVQKNLKHLDYEVAINHSLKQIPFKAESTQNLPWTEIDFPHDIQKAISLLPAIDPF